MIISAQNYIESRQFSLHKTILYTVKMIISAQNYEQSRRHLCTKLYYIQSRRLSLHKTINHKTIISAQNCTVKMIISAQNYIQSRRLSLHKTIYSQNDYLCTKLYRVKMIISAQNYIESRWLSLHKTMYSQDDYLCTKLYTVKIIISAQNYIVKPLSMNFILWQQCLDMGNHCFSQDHLLSGDLSPSRATVTIMQPCTLYSNSYRWYTMRFVVLGFHL